MRFVSRIASIILLVGIIVVTLSPIQFRPETGRPDLERAEAYILLGIALGLGFPERARYSVLFLAAVAAVLEALQLIVPGRDGRFHDMLVKAAAGIVAIALTKIAMIILSRVRRT